MAIGVGEIEPGPEVLIVELDGFLVLKRGLLPLVFAEVDIAEIRMRAISGRDAETALNRLNGFGQPAISRECSAENQVDGGQTIVESNCPATFGACAVQPRPVLIGLVFQVVRLAEAGKRERELRIGAGCGLESGNRLVEITGPVVALQQPKPLEV